jgi:ferrous iron transport protein A
MEKRTLSDAIPGNSYFIQKIKDEIRLNNRLSSMGILPGTQIEICQNNKKQPVLFFANDTLIAISRKECKKIEIGGELSE